MAYVSYEYYKENYPETNVQEAEFERLLWDAERAIDKSTSGIDNVKKLRIAFPLDEYDAETVKRSVCALIDLLHQISMAEKTMRESYGFVSGSNGTLQGKIVTSVSAGNESVSYSVGNVNGAVGTAVKGVKEKELVIRQHVERLLSGVADANGVNLLYMGKYPVAIQK